MAINKVFLVGNVTADCKMYVRDGEVNCITFSLAVDERRYNHETEEYDSAPNYFDCAMFGKRADALKEIIVKGIRVAITGKLRYSSYERDGEKRSSISVIVDDLDFMSAKADTKKQTRKTKKAPVDEELPF